MYPEEVGKTYHRTFDPIIGLRINPWNKKKIQTKKKFKMLRLTSDMKNTKGIHTASGTNQGIKHACIFISLSKIFPFFIPRLNHVPHALRADSSTEV